MQALSTKVASHRVAAKLLGDVDWRVVQAITIGRSVDPTILEHIRVALPAAEARLTPPQSTTRAPEHVAVP